MARGRILINALPILVPVWGLTVGITLYFYFEKQKTVRTEILSEQRYACRLVENLIDDDLTSLFKELERLARDPSVVLALSDDPSVNQEARTRLTADYVRLSSVSELYDQIRLIDKDGWEVIRVNYNDGAPAPVPKEGLQHKGRRYYFRDAITLDKGEIFISPFDLNIEHGKIETPTKPMIRVATVVFDSKSQKRGVIILNYFGKVLLDKIARLAQTQHTKTVLLNAEGFWLKGDVLSDEWGFMYPGSHDKTFLKRYPQTWTAITSATSGQVENHEGVFAYTKVYPLKTYHAVSSNGSPDAFGKSSRVVRAQSYYWIIVSRIPLADWVAVQRTGLVQIVLVFLLISAGVFIGALKLSQTSIRRKALEKELIEANRQLEQKVQARTADLEKEVEERRTAENAASQATEELENIFNASGDGLLVLGEHAEIIKANPAALAFLEGEASTVIGRTCQEVMHDDACETSLCPIEQLRSGSERVDFETKKTRLNGEEAACMVTVVKLTDATGEDRGFIINLKDITEKQRAAEEKRSLEMQLRQTQKMEAIGTLAGGVAHDFNNILMVMMGNVELAMLEDTITDEQTSLLENVLIAGERAKHLVHQILAFSRKKEMALTPVRIDSVIMETVRFLRASLSATIDISTDVEEGMSPIMADTTSLHQIILNLCTNAAHAMEDHGGHLSISCESLFIDDVSAASIPELTKGQYQRLRIADDGGGMSKETLDRIFEPFFTTKPVGKGTGMGLSVVHGIVKTHGGAIGVSSHIGKGTTFDIYLPEAHDLRMSSAASSALATPNSGNEVILYVDDEEMLVDIGRTALENQGYNVVAFTSSETALSYFKEQPNAIDLVVTDSNMPGMTGIELSSAILDIRPELPVVLLSGFKTVSDEVRAKKLGVRRILFKPLRISEIAQNVREVLDAD